MFGGLKKGVVVLSCPAAGTWARTRSNNKVVRVVDKILNNNRSAGLLSDRHHVVDWNNNMYSTNNNYYMNKFERLQQQQVRFKSAKGSQKLKEPGESGCDMVKNSYPELGEYSNDELMNYLGLMSTYGFNETQAAEILVKCPSIMASYKEKIPGVNAWLTNAFFKESERIALIHRHPGVVFMRRSHFSSRLGFLNTYLTISETQQLVLQSIGALVDHESVVQQKLEYLIRVMSHATKKIVSCRVLDHKFSRIRMRHEFLIRAGLFKPIAYRKLIKVEEKEKATKEKRAHYFSPYDIVCSNDQYFLKFCTKGALSVNELVAFEELFEKEVAEEDEQTQNEIEEDVSAFEDNPELGLKATIEEKKQAEANQFYF